MTLTELLDSLDGYGLIVTDDELLEEELNFRGQSLKSEVVITTDWSKIETREE